VGVIRTPPVIAGIPTGRGSILNAGADGLGLNGIKGAAEAIEDGRMGVVEARLGFESIVGM
jgi:hypothetical protein